VTDADLGSVLDQHRTSSACARSTIITARQLLVRLIDLVRFGLDRQNHIHEPLESILLARSDDGAIPGVLDLGRVTAHHPAVVFDDRYLVGHGLHVTSPKQ